MCGEGKDQLDDRVGQDAGRQVLVRQGQQGKAWHASLCACGCILCVVPACHVRWIGGGGTVHKGRAGTGAVHSLTDPSPGLAPPRVITLSHVGCTTVPCGRTDVGCTTVPWGRTNGVGLLDKVPCLFLFPDDGGLSVRTWPGTILVSRSRVNNFIINIIHR